MMEWVDMFRHYFPPKGYKPKEANKIQNYTQLRYQNNWNCLMKDAKPDEVVRICDSVWVHFHELLWVLYANGEHIWNMSVKMAVAGSKHSVYASVPEGPLLIIAPNRHKYNGKEWVFGCALGVDCV